MSNLNWQKNSSGNYIASTESVRTYYVLEKRKDGYYNLSYRFDLGETTQLNKSRLSLTKAKQMAEDHYAEGRQKSDPSAVTTGESKASPTPPALPKTGDTESGEDKQRSDPSIPKLPARPIEQNKDTMTSTTQEVDNWAFLGAILSVVFVKALTEGKGLRGAAVVVYNACRTKGERRKIRQMFRAHGYGQLAGLAA